MVYEHMSKLLTHQCDADFVVQNFPLRPYNSAARSIQVDDLTEAHGRMALNLLGELGVIPTLWDVTPLTRDRVEGVAS